MKNVTSICNSHPRVRMFTGSSLISRYRCTDGLFDFRVLDELSQDPGYFQFGSGTTCYGRTLAGAGWPDLKAGLYDALPGVVFEGERIALPFDPEEVVENLRLERYPASGLSASESLLKRIYYACRPFMNRTFRTYTQRLRAASWQKKSFPQWPVDTTVETVLENLLTLALQVSRSGRIPFIWFWPKGARACVAMTHDVETAVGRDFCAELLDIDDAAGIKASYQIVPEGRYQAPAEFLNLLRDRGAEVCVQDLNHDGRLFDDREEFLRRAARINRYAREYGAKGFRSAVLYRRPEWYGDFEFSYDMSIPNVAHLDPQRGGCCTVMPYFIGDVLELPVTTVQDYTLFHVLNERSIDLWKTQIERILARNGLASFIVHPDYITKPDTQSVYKELLATLVDLRQREALWFALPGEIDGWWRARSRMNLVKDRDSWRVVGEGAERAVLAFASIVDGRMVYELEEGVRMSCRIDTVF